MSNKKLYLILIDIAQAELYNGEIQKSQSYENAAILIKGIKGKLTDKHTAYIGDSINYKIQEYKATGNISHLNELRNSKNFRYYKKLISINGVGDSTAKKLLDQGYTTINSVLIDVKKDKLKLTNQQYIGITLYKELQERLSHENINKIKRQLSPIIKKFTIAGSFRRNEETSGDVDIIVINNDPNYMKILFDLLSKKKWLYAFLSNGNSRISYIHYLDDKYAQVDILCCTENTYPFALLYFTGSWPFNLAMRKYAKSLGYKLNQNGLYKMDGEGEKNISSEHDIFERLNLEWKEPENRKGPDDIIPIHYK